MWETRCCKANAAKMSGPWTSTNSVDKSKTIEVNSTCGGVLRFIVDIHMQAKSLVEPKKMQRRKGAGKGQETAELFSWVKYYWVTVLLNVF